MCVCSSFLNLCVFELNLTSPPGTGKTTCAKRFGIMFKNLELLPRSDVEYTTPSMLIDRYVGGSSANTLEAMRRAKGGILFIDEAYGLFPRNGNAFGRDGTLLC